MFTREWLMWLIFSFFLIAEWMRILDPRMASVFFCRILLREQSQASFHSDLKDIPEDQERSILSFYKAQGVNWATPLIYENPSLSQVLSFYFRLLQYFLIYSFIICICRKSFHSCHLCFIGDAAIGDGVNRHLLSVTTEKLRTGFSLNFGIHSIIVFNIIIYEKNVMNIIRLPLNFFSQV